MESLISRATRRLPRRSTVALIAACWLVAMSHASTALAAPPNCDLSLGFATLHDVAPALVGACTDGPTYTVDGDAQQRTTHGMLLWDKLGNRSEFTDGTFTWILGDWWIDHPQDPGIKVELVKRRNDQRFSWESDADQRGEQTVTWASCPSVRHPNIVDGAWTWCTAGPTLSPPTTDVF
jgi:hypothetical protein